MRTWVAFLLVAGVGVLATDEYGSLLPDPSWARPVLNSFQSQQGVKDDDTCTTMYSCSDCKTAKVCKPTADNGVFSIVSKISCPPERPWCNPKSGTCVSEVPESCGGPDQKFICMGNGKYPDKACTKFHVCINYKPTLFECSVPGQNYNAEKQICDSSSGCGDFDCSSVNVVKKVPHTTHNRYFAYCNKEANDVLVVDSCPPYFKLDIDAQTCVPNCLGNGIIPDPTDCHFYYKCSQVTFGRGSTYNTYSRMKCPGKQAYSNDEFLCVDEDKVPQCKKP